MAARPYPPRRRKLNPRHPLEAALFPQAVIHVLGAAPGMTVCGVRIPEAPGFTKATDLGGMPDAMRAALARFPGSAKPCRGCLMNVARKAAKAAQEDGTK